MRLAVITAALYPDRSRIHYLDESARRNCVPLQPFGIGSPFGNWKQMLLEYTLPTMKELSKAHSHVLYVDGADSLFLASIPEIASKFGRLGSPPCLMSADADIPTINSDKFTGALPWRFLNAGGFLTDIDFFLDLVEQLAQRHCDDGDYQNWFIKEWPIKGMVLDHNCEIFQSMDGCPSILPFGRRTVNTITGTWPCILHFRGGYSSPETGRDYRLKPYFELLFGGK